MTDQQPLSRRAAKQAAEKPRTMTRNAKASAASGDPSIGGPETVGSALERITPKQRTILIATALGVVFVMLSVGAVYAGAQVGMQPAAAAPIDKPVDDRLIPLDIAQPAALRTCSVAELAKDERLGVFSGAVINAETGHVLFDRAADAGAAPGDIVKVLTAVAAIASLGADFQFTTRVYKGTEAGSIVLVGGGDPTLSRLPSGQESIYHGAPKLSDLAAATKTTWNQVNPPTVIPGETITPTPTPSATPDPDEEPGDPEPSPSPSVGPPTIIEQPITKIFYDTTAWSATDVWNSDWDSNAVTPGSVPRIVPLMIDGDRSDPKSISSARSADPASRAARTFASALGLNPDAITVTPGAVAPGATLLGEVRSQPVHVLVRYMLAANDNTLAEMLARKVASEAGLNGSAASLNQVIPGAVAQLGLDGSQVSVADGSGLSPKSTVPPKLVAQLMAELEEETGSQLAVYESLPIAGEGGALQARFSGANEIARGSVKAMPGATATARTLGGLIMAEDGTLLAFAFYALGTVDANAAAAIDSLTAGVYACGNNLSNY